MTNNRSCPYTWYGNKHYPFTKPAMILNSNLEFCRSGWWPTTRATILFLSKALMRKCKDIKHRNPREYMKKNWAPVRRNICLPYGFVNNHSPFTKPTMILTSNLNLFHIGKCSIAGFLPLYDVVEFIRFSPNQPWFPSRIMTSVTSNDDLLHALFHELLY